MRGAGAEVAFDDDEMAKADEVFVSGFSTKAEAGIERRPLLRMDGWRSRVGVEIVSCAAVILVVLVVCLRAFARPKSPNLMIILLLKNKIRVEMR